MEIIVSLFIIMILMLGIYGMILLSLKVTADNQAIVEATEIANEKMEDIRNLPYRNVGVAGGIPSGSIPQEETVTRDGSYAVNTYITYYDDPYDGEAGSSTPDTIINDYKIATVVVSWEGRFGHKEVTIFSKIIPHTLETPEGLGVLKIRALTKALQPVAAAEVRVVNNSTSPPIDVVNLTGDDGTLLFPAPTSTPNTYEITVTKTGYGTDRTNAPSTALTPYHMTLANEGDKAEELFYIDKLAALQIRTVTSDLPDNWQVNTGPGGRDQAGPGAGTDASDNIYFAWQSYTSTSSHVYLQKYDSSGVKQWTNDIVAASTQFQTNPDIVTTSGGVSYVVWQDNSLTLKQLTAARPQNRFADDYPPDYLLPGPPRTTPPYVITTSGLIPRTALSLLGIFSFPKLETAIGRIMRIAGNGFAITPAMAAGAVVQTKIGSVPWNGSTLTATFDNPPTEGNMIIAVAVHRHANASFALPYNTAGSFTEAVYSDTSYSLDTGIWYKVAGFGEPSQVTLISDENIDGGVLVLLEVSGLDPDDPIDQVVPNDQTDSSSKTATTGFTASTEAGGFAVAACAFADNDFNTPNSANWSSGSSDNWTHRLWRDWWTDNDGSLAVATLDVTAAAAQSATLTLTGGWSNEERNSALAVFRLYAPDNVVVSASGTQTSAVTAPQTDQYIGGAFVLTDTTGAHTVNDITITENGTIDAQNDLTNIKLFYDIDATAPYDCASESYGGSESQFGATDADGFSSANGTSTFSGAIDIDTAHTMCVYAVMDIGSGADGGDTVDISINNPSSDVVLSSGSVTPATPVELSGSTDIDKPAELQQIHYRWRNDDGSEADAGWAASQDIADSVLASDSIRLRFEITNGGTLTSAPAEYRLEYGKKTTDCASIAGWTALPADSSQHWRVIDSTYLTDNDPTTDVVSGLTNENYSFTAGYVKDGGNQTPAITLAGNEFTEIEYTIKATGNAEDSDYCFRLTDAGSTADFTYAIYPEASIRGDENIFIKALNPDGSELWSVKRANEDISGEDQTDPCVALTDNFGTATTVVAWTDGRNGNDDIYAQSFDYQGNKIWANDLEITDAATDDLYPAIAIDPNDDLLAAWTNDSATDQDIYLTKYDLTGVLSWPTAIQVTSSGSDEYSPSLTTDSSGDIYLAWTEDNAGAYHAYIAKFDTDGTELWRRAVNTDTQNTDRYEPSLYIRGTDLYVSWTDERKGNPDIYVQKYDLDGVPQWTRDAKTNVGTDTFPQDNSRMVIDASGDPYAVWQDSREGNYDIYAAEPKDPGVLVDFGNVPLIVTGTKLISQTPPIYEYDQQQVTDASGYVTLPVEWDDTGYSIEINSASSSLSIIESDPVQPLVIMPEEFETITLYVE